MSDCAIPTALVRAEWAQQHLDDPGVRFVEVDVDTEASDQGHLPDAVGWNWEMQLSDGIRTYCGVGVRSAHTWFVLHELLGFDGARNYDGGWAEWGSVIGAPIEVGDKA